MDLADAIVIGVVVIAVLVASALGGAFMGSGPPPVRSGRLRGVVGRILRRRAP